MEHLIKRRVIVACDLIAGDDPRSFGEVARARAEKWETRVSPIHRTMRPRQTSDGYLSAGVAKPPSGRKSCYRMDLHSAHRAARGCFSCFLLLVKVCFIRRVSKGCLLDQRLALFRVESSESLFRRSVNFSAEIFDESRLVTIPLLLLYSETYSSQERILPDNHYS